MITSFNFDFCHVEIYEDYIKNVFYEGVTLQPEHNDIWVQIAHKYFKNKSFVCITDRIYSYAVNPLIYKETSKISNLIGFAVISDKKQQKMQVRIEKAFFKKEFHQFDTMKEALRWKNKMIENSYLSAS